jgi:GT2 family glycosyltransferase
MIKKNNVTAVVVTYNRLELLKRCVDKLKNQSRKPETVLVINNGSTDETKNWLDQQDDVISIHQENVGSAGGQKRGLMEAVKLGVEWVWMMDDDGYPEERCLEELLKVAESGCDYVSPCLYSDEGICHSPNVYKHTFSNVLDFIGGPFNGILISSKVPKYCGYPNEDFFIWGEEFEYIDRLREKRIPMLNAKKAIFIHPLTTINYKTNKRLRYLFRNAIWRWKLYPKGLELSKLMFSLRAIKMLIWSFAKTIFAFQASNIFEASKGIIQGIFTNPSHHETVHKT